MLWVEALGLLLIGLYVLDAIVVCDTGATVIVGWRPGTGRVRTTIDVSLGRPRTISCGRLLPPLHPPIIVEGDRLDAEAAAAVHAHMVETLRPLRVLTNVLFVSLFLLLPGAVLAPSGLYRPPAVFVLIGIVWVAVAVATHVAVRQLYPDRQSRPAIAATLSSPISAVRVVDVLARRLLAAWHPVAVARVLCTREDYLALARTACFSVSESRGPLRNFLRAAGDWEAVQAPPAVEDGCSWYCPRCHAQFLERVTGCPDCSVSLRAHQPAPPIGAESFPMGSRT